MQTPWLFTWEKSSQSIAIKSIPSAWRTFTVLYRYIFSTSGSDSISPRNASSIPTFTLTQESAVSPTTMYRKGRISAIIFSTISPENTTTSDSTSMVTHTVTFWRTPERVFFSASARFRDSPVLSRGTWFCLKLWVSMPCRSARMGSIFLILREDSHTARATAVPKMPKDSTQGRGRNPIS